MKAFFLVCSIVLLIFTPQVMKAAEIDPVAAVIAAEKARGAALLAADTNTLARILADDFKYTHSSGMAETKAIHIGSFIKGLRYQTFDTSKIVGHIVTPDVVVLNGIIDQRKGVAEKWTDYHLLFQSVWRSRDGAWQLVSLQTAAPPAPAPAKQANK